MTDLSGILPGARIAWDFEPSSPESGPSGHLDTMEGTVLLCNAGPKGRSFWVAADDGSHQMVERSWIIPADELSRREELFECSGPEVWVDVDLTDLPGCGGGR